MWHVPENTSASSKSIRFVCVCVHVCVSVCAPVEAGSQPLVSSMVLLRLVFWERVSLNLGLSDLARLGGQWAPGTHLPLPSQDWDYKCMPPHPAFLTLVLGIQTQVLMATEVSPQTLTSFFKCLLRQFKDLKDNLVNPGFMSETFIFMWFLYMESTWNMKCVPRRHRLLHPHLSRITGGQASPVVTPEAWSLLERLALKKKAHAF